MTTTRPAHRTHPLALLLRTLAVAALLAGAGSEACAVNVSITSIQPVASEATLSAAVVQFNRDTSSGPLVVQFTLSGAAATTNSATLPTFTVTSTAAFTLAPNGLSGAITIADNDTFEQLVITPLDNSAITGDLPLVVMITPDESVYNVVSTASSAQIDIAEGDYQASVVVPAPVAYEDTARVGTADDPNAPRRGILRVAFAPIATFPGSTTAPGLTQFYLSAPSGTPVPALGTPLTIGPTSLGGNLTATATAAFGTNGNFISFTPGITVGMPVGSTVSAGTFSGTIALVPPAQPAYDKALKVQFGGSAALPATATGASGGTGSDTYYLSYKIGGSGLGSATDPVNDGVGWNVVAYPGSAAVPGTNVVTLGVGAAIPFTTPTLAVPNPPPPQVIIDGNTYTLAAPFGGAPGPMTLTTGLLSSVHDGDAVSLIGLATYLGEISAPVEPGTTSLTIENGSGTFVRGDVFTLAGEDAATCRYVILSDTPGTVAGTQVITFRRYTAGTVGFDGVNNLHSALSPGSSPSPALSTALNVSDDPPFNGTANIASTSPPGIVQLLVPAESAQVDFGVNPINNGVNTGRLSVTMALYSDLNYATATPTSGQVIIAGAGSTASIATTANAVLGATAAATTDGSFQISLTTAFSQDITVPFTITGSGPGVAQPGIDYALSSSSSFAVANGIYSVVIPANSTSATITVTPLPTATLGISGKTVTLTLSPTYDYLLAAASGSLNASATLSLLPPPPPTPQLSVATLTQAQQPKAFGGTETVGIFTISAQVAPVNDLSVQYALSGSAAPGTDYLIPADYSTVSGTGVATILAGTTSVNVPVDPNISSPLPPYKLPDQATITLLPASSYILTAAATSTATLNILQGTIQVNDVTAVPTTGTFLLGATIAIDVNFSAPVTVTGTPTLALNTGPTSALATYASGSGTSTLVFTYTVGPGDASPRLDYLSSAALVLAGGSTISATTNPANFTVSLALPPPGTTGSLYSNSTLVIDGAPTVALDPQLNAIPSEIGLVPGSFTVTSTSAQTVPLTVFYALSGNAVSGVDYAPPGGTPGQLVIPANQTSAQLTITPLANPLVNPDATVVMTLVAGSGYHLIATPTAAATTTDTLTITQSRIGVVGVTAVSPNGTYHIGDVITLAVNLTAPVTVTGMPQLALAASASAVATYTSGSGTSTLLFAYTVAYGDASAHLDYAATGSLSANGGTLADASPSGLPVQLTLAAPGAAGSLSAASALVVDGTPAIAIAPLLHLVPSEVGPTPGQFVVTCIPPPTAPLTVTYTLGGTAVIGTDIAAPASADAPASFTPGTMSGTLTIPIAPVVPATTPPSAQATLVITPLDNPLVNTDETVAMTLVAGTGYHLAGAPAVTTDTLTVAQDRIGVLSVTTTAANGTYTIGQSIALAVNFSAAVTVTGTPQLALATGPTNAVASYTSGSGSSTLLFTYVVGVSDASAKLDYLSTSALTGTLAAATGSLPVQLALSAPGSPGSLSASSALVIDGSPALAIDPTQHVDPIKLGVKPGQFVVTCSPAPAVPLAVTYTIGGSAVVGTDIADPPAPFTLATLTGTLTIPAGSTSAALPITPIDDATFNLDETVVMTLVAGAGYHLAPAPAVSTDTLTVIQDHIAVTNVSALPTSGTFHLGSQITITVTFSAPVVVGGSGTPTLALNTGSTNAVATLAAGAASGSGSATLDFTYVVGAGDTSAHLDYLSPVALQLNGATLSDASSIGLPVLTPLAAPGTHGSLASSTTLVIDGTVPVVTAVSATSPNGTYTYGQSLTLTVSFSLPVNVSGTPELQLATGATPAEATYAGGNGTAILDFTYVVGANDASADLDCTSANALTLDGGSITWVGQSSVPAALALPAPGTAGSLGVNKALVINGTLPSGKPPVGSISGPDAGTGGGCGLGSGIAGLAGALALCLRAAALRRHRR